MLQIKRRQIIIQQECIPVGCVPFAAVAVSEGAVSALGGVCLGGVCPGEVCPGVGVRLLLWTVKTDTTLEEHIITYHSNIAVNYLDVKKSPLCRRMLYLPNSLWMHTF